eukprot:TRINITY_DN1177_c0_g1::TRINITY_DN1177_c0_g1_i1::g.17246::m.17246 TRINITY_DN1177_c0_g1::TRINITY_DN1177_c0_g1_i1::g.17246  ORF type:complete len:897 (-),score=274.08,sp/P49736/MCM2_HUMAN/51.94/0.0,MCM/PF00493.18/7.3e-136,MCM2_N/PF12619.3/1.8e-27,MCM2_N/PF12619.3/3.4e+03,MCM_N/PF14551.1/6.2e-16,MCM_N/PF14551.1/9.3e+02,Mg_chelatase/PF01078.16/14,Mg_chelatase/PF01078.16/9.4e-06,AAA_5/PF07728.9/0.00084,AAA_3/PF07726.6/6.3e+03,AAA_3/PF07726.6/2.2e+03,AAA_3/PF07726.6/0.0019,AAA_3/PF07726.6/4.6e+03,AAA/PF
MSQSNEDPSQPPLDENGEEAMEDAYDRFDSEIVDEDEGEGEDLIGDGMERDYEAIPEQDVYDPEMLDDSVDVAEMTPEARRRAEAQMRKRDREQEEGRERRRSRLPSALLESDDESMMSSEVEERPTQRRRAATDSASPMVASEIMDDLDFEWDQPKGSLTEWIAREPVRRRIQREFKNFLLTYVDREGRVVYVEAIKDMARMNSQTLEITYIHLGQLAVLAIWIADAPKSMLEIFDEVAMDTTLLLFPQYKNIHDHIYVRIRALSVDDSLRGLRRVHLNTLVKVRGVVTRRTGVFPQLQLVKYDCAKCNAVLGPFVQTADTEITGFRCMECQSRGPFRLNAEQTVYRNFQKAVMQESPGSVPPGRLPRSKEVILVADLIDCCKPGDEVVVTGVYCNSYDATLNSRNGFPVFQTVIEANHVARLNYSLGNSTLTTADIDEIRKLADDPNIAERIIASIAPSIYGHYDIKRALACALFTGVPKEPSGKHRIRGDINVLLLGDPGVAKSQFLKYVATIAPRAIFTTGKGASAVGLTAAVHKDRLTREYTLEGGALVLADNGMCLIDEFDKMNETDRTSIHEAMEQQTISISKAGIVTSLQARCAVAAAANPIGGRFNPSKSFAENVDLTEPILSRFDILCVIRDVVDPVVDEMLARHVVQSHSSAHPSQAQAQATNPDDSATHTQSQPAVSQTQGDEFELRGIEPLPQAMLRKYIQYARNTAPRLAHPDRNKMTDLYVKLRQESERGGAMPLVPRHLESMIRISEAHAKMRLRHEVESLDTDFAISVMVSSFINSQKFSVQKQLRNSFRQYLTTNRDYNIVLFNLLKERTREMMRYQQARYGVARIGRVEIDVDDYVSAASDLHIDRNIVYHFIRGNAIEKYGYEYQEAGSKIVKIVA